MSPNKARPSVSIDLARILIRYASEKGLNAGAIWQAAGLRGELLYKGDARLSARRFDALWRAVEAEAGDENFGLQLGESLKDYAGGHLLYAVLMNSPTVGAALSKFCRYHCIMANVVQPRFDNSGKKPKVVLDVFWPGLPLGLGYETFIFSLFASILDNLTGGEDSISEVRFSHPPPEKMNVYHRIFKCPTRFKTGQSALILEKSIMTRPVFLANPDLLAELEKMALRHMQQVSIGNSVRFKAARVLGRILMNGERPKISEVAKMLAMSPRRLQQKLNSEQTSYREILDQVRKDAAVQLMEDREHTISDITFILGFSEQSSFTHAFQKWTGVTPGQYRKSLKA